MPVKWRESGEDMGVIDLRKLDGDQIVIHFGGDLKSVDAYTFGNSLISIADTIRAINDTINPGQKIEVRLEAVGPGSFRAVIKKIKKGIGGFISRAPENVFWAVLGAWLITPSFEQSRTVTVYDDRVEIVDGETTVIISREAFGQFQNTQKNPNIPKSVRKTFDVIDRDDSIENFGITPKLDDPEPLLQISRDQFQKIASDNPIISGERRRLQSVRSIIIVLKTWVNASKNKWSFEWNGIPIAAHISDVKFLNLIKEGEIRFGNGDALDVDIDYFQDFDENLGVWVNDNQSYIISSVYAHLSKNGVRLELK
jgi:hypothetical protein